VIIALLLTVAVIVASWTLNSNQKKREKQSKSYDYKNQPSHVVKSGQVGSPDQLKGLEVLMIDYSYEVKNSSTKVGHSSNIKLLSHVTGKFNAGSLTCILGPSGCGKSTFLQVIRNKSKGLVPAGSIDIYSTVAHHEFEVKDMESGVVPDRSELTHLEHHIGFVPQEDVIDRTLTIRELLMLNTRLRQPTLTSIECASVVEDVMLELHIRHIADTVIGGSANKSANVSGQFISSF